MKKQVLDAVTAYKHKYNYQKVMYSINHSELQAIVWEQHWLPMQLPISKLQVLKLPSFTLSAVPELVTLNFHPGSQMPSEQLTSKLE